MTKLQKVNKKLKIFVKYVHEIIYICYNGNIKILRRILAGTATQRKEVSFMQITDVRVRKVAKEGKLKAIVSITMDDEFVVHDIKVIEGEKGLFIAMPSKKALDGEYRDIAHPINSGTRERIQTLILQKYEEASDEDIVE